MQANSERAWQNSASTYELRKGTQLELGMVGLGKMGANMAQRLHEGGHRVVGYDIFEDAVASFRERGMEASLTIDELVATLPAPRTIWVMVPAGDPVDTTIAALIPHLEAGDTIVDGGNSNYKDTLRRASSLSDAGLHFVDVGTSGGIWGLTEGYSMMIGGEEEVVERLTPFFETLAPSVDTGWGRMGANGSGHYVKMIHNGVEYGLMQAYAEGFAILNEKKEFELDLHQVAQTWQVGSVVRSWLLDLIAEALGENPDLEGIAPFVPDSGEGRWTVFEAIDLNVSAPIITQSLFRRISSRDDYEYADRLLSAMRNKFGGHAMLGKAE